MYISIVIVAFPMNVTINVMFSFIKERQARRALLVGGGGSGCGGIVLTDSPLDSEYLYSLLDWYMKLGVLVFLVDVCIFIRPSICLPFRLSNVRLTLFPKTTLFDFLFYLTAAGVKCCVAAVKKSSHTSL